MSAYTLEPVAKGSLYTNVSGAGRYAIKVRAVTRDDDGAIIEKRGAVHLTNDPANDAPVFVLNAYKEWDGRGQLEFVIIGDLYLEDLINTTLPEWTKL